VRSVLSLGNKRVRVSETHRYHRNKAILPHHSKNHPKGLAYVSVPLIAAPLNVMMTMAQWEREVSIERTAAMVFKRLKGERISGRLPFGSNLAADGKTLVDNPVELRVLDTIRAWRSEGWGARRIAAELNTRGVPSKTGSPWSHSTIRGLADRAD
jgi:Recombinase